MNGTLTASASMNELNQSEQSGSNPTKLIDESEAKTELRSFTDKQFLAFVPTLMLMRIVVLFFDGRWEDAISTPGKIPIILLVLTALSMACWIPHYLYAVRSSKVRCGGPYLSGIVGGASFAVGMAIHLIILQIAPEPIFIWVSGLPFYVWLPLYVIGSLISVTVLGHFRSKYQTAKRVVVDSSET